MVITLPDEVSIYEERIIERDCSYNLAGFTASRINCKVNGNKITVRSGFAYSASTTMTDNDAMVPPLLKFSLPAFWNPRTMVATGAFSLSVYSDSNDEIYSWNTTAGPTVNGVSLPSVVTDGPSIQLSEVASP
jgi:hypothetical protein